MCEQNVIHKKKIPIVIKIKKQYEKYLLCEYKSHYASIYTISQKNTVILPLPYKAEKAVFANSNFAERGVSGQMNIFLKLCF